MANETVRPFKWRTANNNNYVWVDSFMGTDSNTGRGTQLKPWRTLAAAFKVNGSTTYIVRGYFSEECLTAQNVHAPIGNYVNAAIFGDYPGAAIFDGGNNVKLDAFNGCQLGNVIVMNIPTKAVVDDGYAAYAGLGRAGGNNAVGGASYVYGLAGSSNVCKNAAMYMGALGANNGVNVQRCVFDAPLPCPQYKVSVIGVAASLTANLNNTFLNCRINNRQKKLTDTANQIVYKGLFANFDMVANDWQNNNSKNGTVYKNCLFGSDCDWYFLAAVAGSLDDKKYVKPAGWSGWTNAQRKQDLLNWMQSVDGTASGLADWSTDGCGMIAASCPTFTDCIFSAKTINQLMNKDYSPKLDANCWLEDGTYIGAIEPAQNIPFINANENAGLGSAGQPETWDETTLSGCLKINALTHELEVDDSAAASSVTGELFSKIIKLDVFTEQINAINATFNPQFLKRCAVAMKPSYTYGQTPVLGDIFGNAYNAGDTLVDGKYFVAGKILYNSIPYQAGNIIDVAIATASTFEAVDAGSKLYFINEMNIQDVVYARCRQSVYAYVKPRNTGVAAATENTLEEGGVYYNGGNKSIVHHGRTVAPGESFTCKETSDCYFTCEGDNNYQVAIMFDDSRVPDSSQWCPASLIGEYYVRKNSGAIVTDTYGVPYSSGNPRDVTTYPKSTIDRFYVQFAIFVQRPVKILDEEVVPNNE